MFYRAVLTVQSMSSGTNLSKITGVQTTRWRAILLCTWTGQSLESCEAGLEA